MGANSGLNAWADVVRGFFVGRVAMLGFLGLIIVEETVKGGAAFFPVSF